MKKQGALTYHKVVILLQSCARSFRKKFDFRPKLWDLFLVSQLSTSGPNHFIFGYVWLARVPALTPACALALFPALFRALFPALTPALTPACPRACAPALFPVPLLAAEPIFNLELTRF